MPAWPADSPSARSTAWRYLREAIDLVAALADDVRTAARKASRLACAVLDGTLIAIDRPADDRLYHSGKHHRHGVSVQFLADPAGRLVWASPALPGAVHDLTAARRTGLADALTDAGVQVFADRGYQSAGGVVRTPFKCHRHRPRLSRNQKAATRSHARIRAIGERAAATLKAWKALVRLRCCPRRATAVIQAIVVLQLIEEGRHSG